MTLPELDLADWRPTQATAAQAFGRPEFAAPTVSATPPLKESTDE